MDVLADLAAENDGLERILLTLDEDDWQSPSGAPGWRIVDVVLHLAQTDEAVVLSASTPTVDSAGWRTTSQTVDELVERMVRDEQAAPAEVFARWQAAHRASVAALEGADPGTRLPWAAAPLKPATLATTRLAEHWAHGLDITGPLGIEFPDTDRLRHIAWLGHSTLPYAFAVAGEAAHPVSCELTGPQGDTWCYGPPDAASSVTGSAGSFCRVGARRLAPEQAGLVASGPHALTALRVLRNYAA